MSWSLAAAYVLLLAWSVYLGGALVMELVWRPAQEGLPMSQIGVACRRMGRRYRWIALSMLGLIGAVGLPLVLTGDGPLAVSTRHGRTVAGLVACWLVLAALVSGMAFLAHPALHSRTSAGMSPEERERARARVGRSIRRMDVLLRLELGVALVATLLGASLPAGGLL